MKIVIFSDIHGNLEALEEFLKYHKKEAPDFTICLGDVVGYGANPDECCDIVSEIADITLLGNHDAAVIGVMSTEYYYEAARNAILWTREQLSEKNFNWLLKLPYSFQLKEEGVGFFHGAPLFPSNFYYVISRQHAQMLGDKQIFEKLTPVTFIGHSHMTKRFVFSENNAREFNDEEVPLDNPNVKYVLNIGSIGQPRDRNPNSCFVIYDTETKIFRYKRFEYDIKKAAEKIYNTPLDDEFGKRLFEGR